ncbi:MAG: transglycosylase family protein [Actinomycetota bacterium]
MQLNPRIPLSSARPGRGIALAAAFGAIVLLLAAGYARVGGEGATIEAGSPEVVLSASQLESTTLGGGSDPADLVSNSAAAPSAVAESVEESQLTANAPAGVVEPVLEPSERVLSATPGEADASDAPGDTTTTEAPAETTTTTEAPAEETTTTETAAEATTTEAPAEESSTTEAPAEETTTTEAPAETTTTAAPASDTPDGWVDAGHGVFVPPVLLKIRFCESTDNYTAANTSSSARGAYQFLTGSWDWYGHAERTGVSQAHLATPAQQDQAALLTWQQDGTTPWNASRHCWG